MVSGERDMVDRAEPCRKGNNPKAFRHSFRTRDRWLVRLPPPAFLGLVQEYQSGWPNSGYRFLLDSGDKSAWILLFPPELGEDFGTMDK
jgi:hypothetical protein